MVEVWDLIDIKKERTGIFHERGEEDLIPEVCITLLFRYG